MRLPDQIDRKRVWVVVLGVLALLVMAGSRWIDPPSPEVSSPSPPPVIISTECEKVAIYSSLPGLPYTLYAKEIGKLLEEAGPTSGRPVRLDKPVEVVIPDTTGAVTNIKNLTHSDVPEGVGPECRLAFTQMNIAADATKGFYQFDPDNPENPDKIGPISDLATIGFIYYDIVHIIVRADSEITKAEHLCDKTVGAALTTSGSAQIVKVLENLLGCTIAVYRGSNGSELSTTGALDALESGFPSIDAVVWVAGSPTEVLQERAERFRIRLLPMRDFWQRYQGDFDKNYSTRLEHNKDYYKGNVFEPIAIMAGDYENVGTTQTFMVPNGIVVRKTADDGLVRFLTRALFTERAAFERRLWEGPGDRKERVFPGPKLVSENPLFCYVPPHEAAVPYYEEAARRDGYAYRGQC